MKTAIVLGGGGSKGAYHIGAWRALRELGIEYHIITGTSIGALNGVLMVQDDYDKALRLWREIDISQIAQGGLNLRMDMGYYVSNSDKLLPFLKSYATHKGMDIAPLRGVIQSACDERFFSSKIEYGLVSVRLPSFAPVLKRKSELDSSNLASWVLASASCFPIFPVCEIEGESYIDGGYYDNLPIHLAFELGAERVIAIALNPEPHYCSTHPLVKTIQPISELGGMMDFNQAEIAHNMELGYLDTMRGFGRLWGRAYAFTPNKERLLQYARRLGVELGKILRRELQESEPKPLQKTLHKLTSSEILSLSPLSDRLLALLCAPCALSDSFGAGESERQLAAMFLNLLESQLSPHPRDRIYTLDEALSLARANLAHPPHPIDKSDSAILSTLFSCCITD